MTDHDHPTDHDHNEIYNRGLQFDLSTLLARRRVLGLLGGAGLAALVGCTTDTPTSPTSTGPPSATTDPSTSAAAPSPTNAADLEEIPQETAGPYPGDGSNGPNILTQSGIVRRDIRSSIGSASGVAAGIPLTIDLTVLDVAAGGAPLAGGAVYLWQSDREGRYSMYSQGVTNENYLRGVQEVDASGKVSFLSVFPACYAGRWPHIHFEVYRSLASATSAGNKISTSQIALPKDVCDTVYATDGYSQSVRNMGQVSLESDNVFRDGWEDELGTVTGSVSAGYTVALTVPVV
jgi:protocatechuate 3,4-dioxygenase beta subunit